MKGNCQFVDSCASGHGFPVEDIFKRCRCGPKARRTWRGFLVLECAQVLPLLTTSGGKTPTFSIPEGAFALSRSCLFRVPWQVSESQPCRAWDLTRKRTGVGWRHVHRRSSVVVKGASPARGRPTDRGPERRDLPPESPAVSILCRLGYGTAAWFARSVFLVPPGWDRVFPAFGRNMARES